MDSPRLSPKKGTGPKRSRRNTLVTDNIDFDEFLEHVGGWGVFQWKLLGVLMFSTFVLSYVGYSPILYLSTPDHWCKIPENYTEILQISEKIDLIDLMIPIDESTMEKSKCYMYDPDSISDNFGNKSNWNKIKCMHGWHYNFTGYFTSISTDFDWVCDDEWKPQFSQTIFFAGAVIGTLFFGWMIDQYGRVWTMMIATLNILVTGIATPFSNGFLTFAVFRFLMGMSYPTFFLCGYMLVLEYVSINKRSLVGNLCFAIGLPLGGCSQAWILKALGDWKIFHHILFSQTAIILIAPWFVKESSRWLITKGRIDEAIEILEHVAKENGKKVDPELMKSYKKTATEEYKTVTSTSLSVFDLFKTPVLRTNVILMIINWGLTSFLFEANFRSSANLPYSIYIVYTIFAFLEFPSDMASIWGLEIIGRRWSAVSSLAGFSVVMIICIALINHPLVLTVLAMVGRLIIVYAMNAASQLSLEVVPTQLRGQGNALANVCAQAASLFAPQIVYSKVIDPRMPFIVMAIVAFLAAILAIFLPETAGIKLPDSIMEAEVLFKRKNILKKDPVKVLPREGVINAAYNI